MKRVIDKVGLQSYTTQLVQKLKTLFPSQTAFNTVDNRSQQTAATLTGVAEDVAAIKATTPAWVGVLGADLRGVTSPHLNENVSMSILASDWEYSSEVGGLVVPVFFRIKEGLNLLRVGSRKFYHEWEIIRTGSANFDWFSRRSLGNGDTMNRINNSTTAQDVISTLVDFVPQGAEAYASDSTITTVSAALILPGQSSIDKTAWISIEMAKG